jgi:hypothetical protein
MNERLIAASNGRAGGEGVVKVCVSVLTLPRRRTQAHEAIREHGYVRFWPLHREGDYHDATYNLVFGCAWSPRS